MHSPFVCLAPTSDELNTMSTRIGFQPSRFRAESSPRIVGALFDRLKPVNSQISFQLKNIKITFDFVSQVLLLPLQRKPCNRQKIDFVSIRRQHLLLIYSVTGWTIVYAECKCVCVCVCVCEKKIGLFCHFGPFWTIVPI